MPTKDTFKYEARWDSVGLCCAFCRHQANAKEWPNTKRDYMCALHQVPLAVELGTNNYMDGEWFCRDFEDNGSAYPPAVKYFLEVRVELPENTLLGFYGKDGYLKEIPFSKLKDFK